MPALDTRPAAKEGGAYGHAAACFARPVIVHDAAKWAAGLRLSVAAFMSAPAAFSLGIRAGAAPASMPAAIFAAGAGISGGSAVPAAFSLGMRAGAAPTSMPAAIFAAGVGATGGEASADFAPLAIGIRTGDAPHNSAATLAVGVFVEGGA